jgi:hypothetical protein
MKTEMQTPMSAFSVTAYGNGKMDSGSSKGVVERDPAKALIESLAARLAVLEARPMMPGPGSGDDGDVATLDGSVVVWEKAASGLPSTSGKDAGMVLELEAVGENLQADWKTPPIGLPSMAGKSKYMVLQIDDGPVAKWDVVRAV